MIVTESALREQLRRPYLGALVVVPPGSSLSPSAQDFVAHWRLEVVEREQKAQETAGWDRPSSFPVVPTTDAPLCTTCGGTVAEKPDSLTQLNACHYASKNHPRIRLRGRIDTLQAYALLAASRAEAAGKQWLCADLGTVAAYCRELMSAEYNERAAAAPSIGSHTEAEIHAATHDPQKHLGIAHLAPGVEDPELLHWLNLLRCQAREAELVALDAFPSPHDESGASIVHGLNRLSSVVYYLELLLTANKEGDPS